MTAEQEKAMNEILHGIRKYRTAVNVVFDLSTYEVESIDEIYHTLKIAARTNADVVFNSSDRAMVYKALADLNIRWTEEY